MAESLLKVKSRINTVKSIKKITNAMKLIASSRYSKLKVLFDNNLEYLNSYKKAMNLCLKYIDYNSSNLPTCLIKNNSEKKLYIVVSSTLGLCGGYNHEIEKLADKYIIDKNVDVIFIGEKGYKHYKDRVLGKHFDNYVHLQDILSFDIVNQFRHELDAIYRQEKYSQINIIYTKYLTSLSTKCVNEQLFPLQIDDSLKNEKTIEPLFENGSKQVADLIVPHYLDALLYRCLLESNISEQTQRKNSMENSTTSANQLIYNLGLLYNKVRQQRITQEITEVISGSTDSLDLI